MFNILSYVGMNMQSEVCLWTLLGLVRTIFDATLFKVNANLKQVWQMTMPPELSLPVQQVLRTMISGVMLVQCFTVYVYLASYTVLLYPVFLEERPTLVLPWLLLAAIRKLLCELTSLTIGLGTCLLLGPARPPCIKFVMLKVVSIMPAFYMWMLVFSYYNALKVTSAFKTFTAGSTPSDPDYGLELAVRRRRTKSLLDEDQLRSKLVASLYGEKNSCVNEESTAGRPRIQTESGMEHSTDTNIEDMKGDSEILNPMLVSPNKLSESGSYEDWFGNEVIIPRDTDRILEQFVLMMLRIGVHLKTKGAKSLVGLMFASRSATDTVHRDNFQGTAPAQDYADTPPLVASSSKHLASYVREYPKIFMKKTSENQVPILKEAIIRHTQSYLEDSNIDKNIKSQKHSFTLDSNGVSKSLTIEIEEHKRMMPAFTRSSSVDNVEGLKSETKQENVLKNETIEQVNKFGNYSRTLKQSSDSSSHLHFVSSEKDLKHRAKLENRIKNEMDKHVNENDNYSGAVKQSSCSCIDLHSELSESVDSIIQRMKLRISESTKRFEYR